MLRTLSRIICRIVLRNAFRKSDVLQTGNGNNNKLSGRGRESRLRNEGLWRIPGLVFADLTGCRNSQEEDNCCGVIFNRRFFGGRMQEQEEYGDAFLTFEIPSAHCVVKYKAYI